MHRSILFTDLVDELLAVFMTWHCVDGFPVGVHDNTMYIIPVHHDYQLP